MDFSREIVIHIQDANELDITDAGEFKERRYEQKKAISRCKDALFTNLFKDQLTKERVTSWHKH